MGDLRGGTNVILGYFTTGLMFLVLCLICHISFSKIPYKDIIPAMKQDILSTSAHVKQVALSNPKLVRTIAVLLGCLLGCFLLSQIIPLKSEMTDICADILLALLFFFCLFLFIPQEASSYQGFPVGIFGFIYSLIFMFYNAGSAVLDIFGDSNFFAEDMWMYGYGVTVVTYVICIAALRRFLERDLSTGETFFIGMMMLVTLEFVTYYGIGFFGGLKWYNPLAYTENMFGDIFAIINQGVFLATQTQTPGEPTAEILGYIILNGADILTATIVLGYLMQKLVGKNDKEK